MFFLNLLHFNLARVPIPLKKISHNIMESKVPHVPYFNSKKFKMQAYL